MSQQPPSDDTSRGRPSSSGRQAGDRPRSPYDASPYDHEMSTDPGRPHAYESLYRGSEERGRPTPRHWEPNLKPPEAPVGDDTYGWLYRPEAAQPAAGPVAPPPATPVAPPAPATPVAPSSRGRDLRPTSEGPAGSPESRRPAPRRTGRAVLIVLLVVLVLGAAAAAGMVWQA